MSQSILSTYEALLRDRERVREALRDGSWRTSLELAEALNIRQSSVIYQLADLHFHDEVKRRESADKKAVLWRKAP